MHVALACLRCGVGCVRFPVVTSTGQRNNLLVFLDEEAGPGDGKEFYKRTQPVRMTG